MKVAHISYYPFFSHGGVGLLAREIAVGLSEDFETYVFCPSQEMHEDAPGLDYGKIRFMEWNPRYNDLEIKDFLKSRFEDVGIQVAIFHGGDFSWGVMGGKLSLLNKFGRSRPQFITVNHQSNPLFSRIPMSDKQSLSGGIRSFIRFSTAWFFKNIQMLDTDVEINVSRYEYRMAQLRYPLFARKFKLVYHSRLLPQGIGKVRPSDKEKVILSVGHFAYRKGQHVLLRAFGRIAGSFPSWRLQLVGALNVGEYHSYLESILDDLNIRDQVDFVTETYDPDGYFRRASVYVQPSLVEAYGLALQEAMYFGCACVGSEAGGITDSVTDRDYLYPPGDDERLSSILDKLLASEQLLGEKMERDFTTAHRLGRDKAAMLREYRSLINGLAERDAVG